LFWIASWVKRNGHVAAVRIQSAWLAKYNKQKANMALGPYVWTVVSNAFAIVPVYLAVLRCEANLAAWLVTTAVVSIIYHLSSTLMTGSVRISLCIVDFVCAYTAVWWVAVYVSRGREWHAHDMGWRSVFWGTVAIVLVLAFDAARTSYWTMGALAVAVAGMLVHAMLRRGVRAVAKSPWNAAVAVALIAVAVALQWSLARDPAQYDTYHGLWHMFLFLGAAFAIQVPHGDQVARWKLCATGPGEMDRPYVEMEEAQT